ncbi:aldolase/citrate lyase family protein [Rhodoferax ferrireducens]|uniref:aldolase/citrate lyase family protein n=1 Tax=Rhodoferax ferrireducens TaxID=192843 RepID=UPI000E0D8BF7|nr:aldolase/citrate lyase family protein [Rhodoferax ferrireducens]
MLDLLKITNDPVLARRCDALGGMRLFVDLERMGKAERQAGRNTYISSHQLDDIGHIKAQLKYSRLMVRVNPLHAATPHEVDAVLAQGLTQGTGPKADLLMLPMFTNAQTLRTFSDIVAGRCPIVALLETADALATIDDWIGTPGLEEVFVGLNDLHISLGMRFMFEPLASGMVDRAAVAAARQGVRFGFGGMARVNEGLLPGRDVLAEHLRLGSQAVILSRTFIFERRETDSPFEDEVLALREAEAQLACRTPAQTEADRLRIAACIMSIADGMPLRALSPVAPVA